MSARELLLLLVSMSEAELSRGNAIRRRRDIEALAEKVNFCLARYILSFSAKEAYHQLSGFVPS